MSKKLKFFQRFPWFWSKYGHFSNLFCKAILVRKMTFTIFQNEKTLFWGIKTRSSKCRKIEDFPKGLTHGFGPNMVIFPTLFFKAILLRKMTFTIIQNEKAPLQAIETRSSRIRKIDIYPKGLTHGFGPNMAIFPIFFFGTIGQEYDFFDILD